MGDTITKGLGPGHAGYDNLHPYLQQVANQIFIESGGRVWVGSGWRSIQEQSRIYDLWKKGLYDVPRVARPGSSRHNHGMAIDFSGDLRLAQQLGRKYGLVFPMGDEPWHGQLSGDTPDMGAGFDQSMGIQYNLNYTGGPPMRPEDVLANRMASIMSVVGGDFFTSGASQMMDPLAAAQQFIMPSSEQVQSDIDPMGATTSTLNIPEAGAHQTSPLSPQQFSIPEVSGGPQDTQVNFVPGGDKEQLGAYARSLFGEFGFSDADYSALVWLWNKESGDPRAGSSRVTWNPLAQNPNSSAFGIAQFLNGTWAGTGISKTTNPMDQIRAGLIYIKGRYGNPRNALNFHLRNNWY